MMSDVLDYIAGALISRMHSDASTDLSSIRAIIESFADAYGIALAEPHAEIVARRLEELNLLTRVSDEYAGTYFIPASQSGVQRFVASVIREDPQCRLTKTFLGSQPLLNRVFGNDRYWIDFNDYVAGRSDSYIANFTEVGAVVVPASDRVVSLSDNQRHDLDQAATVVIDQVSKENQIEDRVGFRELVLGQIRAGRELIRAQELRVYLLHELMLATLNALIERYKGQAIAEAAKKLLDLLIEHVFGK